MGMYLSCIADVIKGLVRPTITIVKQKKYQIRPVNNQSDRGGEATVEHVESPIGSQEHLKESMGGMILRYKYIT